jgi:DNA processing protein
VPGPVTSAASAGCHRLLRENSAICVTTPDEMAELAPLPGAVRPAATAVLADAEATRVLDALSGRSPRSATDVAARAGLSHQATQAILARLLLDDRVRESERGWLKASQRKDAAAP